MLLQMKIYLIVTAYFFGAMFMFFFPPRNYSLSGAKIRTKRSIDNQTKNEYDDYIDYETLKTLTNKMATNDKEVVKVVYLTPLTAKNRSLIALELQSDVKTKKPGILIIGALNAMAWGAPNAIMLLAERLLYDSNYQTPFFNDYDWFLIPMANPDGMHFTKEIRNMPPIDDLIWSRNDTARRKTRPNQWHKNVDTEEKQVCFGTNINRNFAYHWQDDVNKMPERCSQYYPGNKPFSTAEAQALRMYLTQIGDSVELAIHLHASFTPKREFILFPWRFSLRLPSNFRTLQTIGEYAARNARLPDGRIYEVHQSSNDNRVAGSITDYISGVVGTELVFLIKPYFPKFPDYRNRSILETYSKKALSSILTLVRGWRRSTKLNTLYFFGREVEF